MLYTFIKADSGVASLEISYIITVKITTMNNKKYRGEKCPMSQPTVAQLLIILLHVYRTCGFTTISTTA
jgi:hypothetical protein